MFNSPSWSKVLEEELDKGYFKELESKVGEEYTKSRCYPEEEDIYNAFNLTPFEEVKVVLIGQDPYPNGHAHGLAFSTRSTNRPVSLRYIFAEIARDVLKISGKEDMQEAFPTNNLTSWANQGVFLLNPVLTVRSGLSNSHADLGWTQFTKAVVKKLWEKEDSVIFAAWGAVARRFLADAIDTSGKTIDSNKNLILQSGHPAAAAYGRDVFSGCQHFSKINERHYINWRTYESNN